MSNLVDRLRGPLPMTSVQRPATTHVETIAICNMAVVSEWFQEAATEIEKLEAHINLYNSGLANLLGVT